MNAEYIQTKFDERLRLLSGGRRREIQHAVSTLSTEAAELTRWLYVNSPLSDCENYDAALLCNTARHGAFLRETMPEVRKLPEYLFLNYVLHPRVNEEALCDCRSFFHAQLQKRITGLAPREAALEINYWNAAQVRYRATDFQTRSALQIYRSGYGRCGEESVFAVNVLRALGIPARQVYVPRWSHCDDNHAWVEVWCDGKWNYLGACEPEEVLNRGWFTSAASRAMLVHSRCFGTPEGEEVISEQGAVTYLNQTARYAEAKQFCVQLCDAEGKPAPRAQVEFCVLNAGQWYPVAAVQTDDTGRAELTCGLGSLLICAHYGDFYAEQLVNTVTEDAVTLRLSAPAWTDTWESFFFTAPSETPDRGERPTETQMQRNRARKKTADAAREKRIAAMYDERRAARLEKTYGGAVRPILKASFGNFPVLCAFLEEAETDSERGRRLRLLQTLTEKDRSCVNREVLDDALLLPEGFGPRVGFEPLSCFRAAVQERFEAAQEFRRDPRKLRQWIGENIHAHPALEYEKLLTLPASALACGCASAASQDLLFAAVCRALGIDARLHPIDRRPEFLSNGTYFPADPAEQAVLILERTPGEEWTPETDFGLAQFSDGAWKILDLSETKWQDDRVTLPLYAGVYRILTSVRLPNGNQHGCSLVLTLPAGEARTVRLRRESVNFAELSVDFSVPDFAFSDACGARKQLSELTKGPALLVWPEPGGEPTEHLFNELLAQKAQAARMSVHFLVRSWAEAENEKFRAVLAALPGASVLLDRDGEAAQLLARKTYVDPDALPLLLVTDRSLHVVSAATGYRVGSVDLALRIYKNAILC